MPRGAAVLVVLLAVAGCGGGSEGAAEEAAPAQPKDDPARGIYNYDHAREVGIRVDPIPPAEQLCPTGVPDDGFSAEELDTPAEVAELEQEMATAPTCIADPRLALIGLGYSVEAVRDAPSAFEKGKLICSGFAPSVPASFTAADFDRLTRERLRNAYGVDDDDSLAELVAGCRTTSWGASALLPD